MKAGVHRVDDDGLHLDRGFDGSLDVDFDGWRGWSVAVDDRSDPVTVRGRSDSRRVWTAPRS